MCFLQVFADFLSCVVNFWPGDDFLGDSSAKTSIFPYNFLERQSCRDPYLSIRNSRRVGIGQTTSLLPPSERVAMFAPRRARSGLGFATGGIAADCRPCRVQVRYFIPQYTLYLCICHCICIVSRLGSDTMYHSVSTDTTHCISHLGDVTAEQATNCS